MGYLTELWSEEAHAAQAGDPVAAAASLAVRDLLTATGGRSASRREVEFVADFLCGSLRGVATVDTVVETGIFLSLDGEKLFVVRLGATGTDRWVVVDASSGLMVPMSQAGPSGTCRRADLPEVLKSRVIE